METIAQGLAFLDAQHTSVFPFWFGMFVGTNQLYTRLIYRRDPCKKAFVAFMLVNLYTSFQLAQVVNPFVHSKTAWEVEEIQDRQVQKFLMEKGQM